MFEEKSIQPVCSVPSSSDVFSSVIKLNNVRRVFVLVVSAWKLEISFYDIVNYEVMYG